MAVAELHAIGARTRMAGPPEQHPTWIELLLGGGWLVALGPKVIDSLRGAWIGLRRNDSTVKVAEIEAENKRWEELWNEVRALRAAEHESTKTALQQERKIGELAAQCEKLAADRERDRAEWKSRQDSIDAVIKKFDALVSPDAVGGTLDELLAAVRTLVAELREARGHDPYPKSVIIGDHERTLGTGA